MTQNNDTSYRQKGRAVFLAAVMVLSVVAMSTAFVGSAAAEQPKDSLTSSEFDSLSDEIRYAGERFVINDSTAEFTGQSQVYLAEVASVNDTGAVTSFGSTTPYNNKSSTSGYFVLNDLDLGGLDAGQYVISTKSSYSSSANLSDTFSVQEQDFAVDFADDAVDEFDGISNVELNSDNRPTPTDYNVTVRVTDSNGNALDHEDVEQLFEVRDKQGNLEGDHVTNINNTAANFLDDYDIDEDTNTDLEDDGYTTINLAGTTAYSASGGGSVINSSDEIALNATNLANGNGLPDRDEYEFEFIVSDTGATATGTLTIGEADEDASFDEGSQRTPAGDIADFSVDLSDAVGNSAYVQIGGEDSDFVDVLYIEADNADETVDVQVNTRLLGTNADEGAVYDDSNTATFQSEVHTNGGISTHPSDTVLYGDDGAQNNNFDKDDGDSNNYLNNLLSDNVSADSQLTRPLQPTEYQIRIGGTTGLGSDEAVFDADAGGDANNQLDSMTLELTQPTIGDVTIHTAPEEDADDTANVSELVDAATARDEVAAGDRLIAQFEATGIYGAIVANSTNGTTGAGDADFDRLDEGTSTKVLAALEDGLSSGADANNESITLEVVAESATGNTDPLEVDLEASDTDTYAVLDEENGQFFIIADTGSDSAFANGDSPDSERSFSAFLEYDADNSDDRYEFPSGDTRPFYSTGTSANYPYLLQGETLSSSSDFSLAPREISFDNVNEDDDVQAQNVENATVSGTTNVAPGSDAELRISGDGFQQGQDLTITEDGSVTTNFDLGNREVGDEFTLDYRVGGGSIDSANGVVVEAVGDTDDGEETNETDDDGEMDDGETEPADDGEMNESTDDGESESTDDGTPGFGAVVALIALIGAALLAVRRQN